MMNFQNQPAKRKSGYCVLTEECAARLRKFLIDEGEEAAGKHFRLSKFALVRASVGLEIQVGSAAMICAGLEGV